MVGHKSFDILRFIACVAALAIMLQIVLGALTRLTGSGLACPDWPLCYGFWFPSPTELSGLVVDYSFAQVMLEWTHRFNAAVVVAPLILAVCVFAWRERKLFPVNWRVSIAALVVLAFQGGVGGLTVFDHNSPLSVAVHFGLASILLALVVSLVRLKGVPYHDWRGRAQRNVCWAVATLGGLTLTTMFSGAIVAKSGATLSCGGWPLCDGRFIPDFNDSRIVLHVTHRLLALITFIGLLWGSWRWRRLRHLAGLSFVQILLGAAVIAVYSKHSADFQVAIGVVHQTVAMIIFATLVWSFWSPSVASRVTQKKS